MRNTIYVVRVKTRTGRTWQYLKEGDYWKQIGPTGRIHRLTAEQLLSHLLPPLAGDQPGISVTVERRRGRPTVKSNKPTRVKRL